MKFTDTFIATNKEAKQYDSVNATLLQKAGFIEQTMAGVYTYLPLGLAVTTKIEATIRQEMNRVASEVLMPALTPTSLWETTGRLETVDILFEARGGNELSRQHNDARYVLSFSHEEVITNIAAKYKLSYRDLPFAVYQIQTKYRNEARPKSGIMRGREFRMKDLYSFHHSEAQFNEFYQQISEIYTRTFEQLGLGNETVMAKASGGDFTNSFSHEFQTKCDAGEDTIFVDTTTGEFYNKEVVTDPDSGKYDTFSAAEVGNIFPLGTKFPDAFNYQFTDEHGQRQQIYCGSYGIGITRTMGVIVEKFHDDNGIIWPKSVAPATVHLVALNMEDAEVRNRAAAVYDQLTKRGIDVLFDDRPDVSAGAKLSDADLIGIPLRAVISRKTGSVIEIKNRQESQTQLISLDTLISLAS